MHEIIDYGREEGLETPHACLAHACPGARPQIMDSVHKLKCNLCGIFAAQLEASGVCSLLQPSCIKPVCDIKLISSV